MTRSAQRPPVLRLLSHAALDKRNLAAFAATLGVACLSGHLWPLLAGIWLYALLIARNVASPPYWRHVLAAEAEALRQLPEMSQLTDPSLQPVVASIRNGYDEIARVLKRTPEPIKAHVRGALDSLDNLRAQAAQLLRQADELNLYLRAVTRESVEGEIRKLGYSMEHADSDVKPEYERALSVRLDQLAAIDRIKREHERAYAALQVIVGTIETFPSWIYRIRVLETRAKEDLISETNEQLARMKIELTSSQQLLDGLAESPEHFVAADDGPW